MSWLFRLLSAAGIALAACTTILLEPGVTRRAEVLAVYGAPSRVWRNADGGETLEYSTQPFGTTCLMVTVGPDGRLREAHDALAEANQARLQVGMSEAEVTRLFGRHRSVEHFVLSGETVWDWNVDNLGGPGIATRYNVHFRDGKVVRSSRSYVFRREPGGVFSAF